MAQGSLTDKVSSLDARYVSAPEAMWRLNGYDLFMKSHTVIRLVVHLPNRQMVYFRAGNEEQAVQREFTRDTTLIAWFKLNQSDENTDIPSYYVYEKKETKGLFFIATLSSYCTALNGTSASRTTYL
ncbi:hypothetical protein RF55_12368 [Lasius niger]|uniref:Uncharacterized protein n=1 Tax=Lasius niger TaxID=67767 RepID=A0A0J7KCX2_LASNI|nr:hypothetical protein RF55_12368 [Lasius niger]